MVGHFLRLERVGDQRPGHRDQVLPLEFGGQAHAVIGRQRVRAGEHHHPRHVQPDEPVTDARAGPRDRQVADVGEGALGQHVQQIARAVEIGAFQRAGLACGERGLVSQHRNDVVVVAHRHRLDVEMSPSSAESACPSSLSRPIAPDLKAAVTNGIRRRRRRCRRRRPAAPSARCWAALRHTHQHAVVAAHPHQIVGEGEVGQQLPLADHGVQVVDGVAGQHRVLGEQVTEGGHRASTVEGQR